MRNKTMFGGAALIALATVAGAGGANAQLATSFKGAPEFSEGDFKFKVRGRVMVDVYNVSKDIDDPDGPGALTAGAQDQSYRRTTLRRGRLGVEGQFDKKWKYKAEIEFGRNNENVWKSALVEYAGKKFSVILGQDKAVAPLEEKTSSRYITFNERAGIHSAFDTGPYIAGVYVLGGGANYSWSFGVGGDDISNSESVGREEAFQLLARATWAPLFDKSPEGLHLLHVGGFLRQRDRGGDGLFQYRARPAALGVDDRTIDTGAIGDEDTTYGVEAAYVLGPFSLQSELMQVNTTRANGVDASLTGGYLDAIWNVTGESRDYRGGTGEFSRAVPAASLASGGPGLVQVAARAEVVDLTDEITKGGSQTGYTLGVNWFPAAYVGFKLNYGYTDISRDGTTANVLGSRSGEAQVVSFRTQFDW